MVLLDEPFSALDASLRGDIRQDVARILTETRTTAILVTHDQDEALALADQIALLADGRVSRRRRAARPLPRPAGRAEPRPRSAKPTCLQPRRQAASLTPPSAPSPSATTASLRPTDRPGS